MKWTVRTAFAHFGTTPRNEQWAWSAKNADGSVVALNVWEDKLSHGVYRQEPYSEKSRRTAGFSDLVKNLTLAQDKCGGILHMVLCKAEDTRASPRAVADRRPLDKIVLRLTEFDPVTGAHTAVVESRNE
jgi:hypothetical protein